MRSVGQAAAFAGFVLLATRQPTWAADTVPSSQPSTAATTQATDPAAERLTRVDHLFGGAAGRNVLTTATEVQAFRLDGNFEAYTIENAHPRVTATDFNVIAGPVDAPNAIRAQLVRFWLDPNNYNLEDGSNNNCMIQWDMAYQFRSGQQTLLLIACLHCGEMAVYLDGHRIGYCMSLRPRELCKMSSELYPDDQALKELAARR